MPEPTTSAWYSQRKAVPTLLCHCPAALNPYRCVPLLLDQCTVPSTMVGMVLDTEELSCSERQSLLVQSYAAAPSVPAADFHATTPCPIASMFSALALNWVLRQAASDGS